jgi:SM-20-related protein
MSANDFLAKLGLYFQPDFVDRSMCDRLQAQVVGAPARPAEVYIDQSATAVDLQVRRTLSVDLPPEDIRSIERALDDLRPDLSRHFDVELTTREPTEFLVYGPGAFFAPHRDRPTGTSHVAADVANRRVSVVVFLSTPTPCADAGYSGGDLRFYRLLDGPEWKEVGFMCDTAPGLLVAFASDTLHEVSPVVAGQRCTVVTWFCA